MKCRQPTPSRRVVGDDGGGVVTLEDGDEPTGGGGGETLGVVGCSERTSVPGGANASASFEVFVDSGVSFTSEALVGDTRSGSTTQPGSAGFHTQLNIY